MLTKTSAEAQNKFGQLLDTVQREAVAITRHGRTAAFIVSPKDMEELMSIRGRRTKAVKDLELWRSLAQSSMTAAAAELTDDDIVRMVHEVREEIARERQSSQ